MNNSRTLTFPQIIARSQIDKLCLVLALMFGLPFLIHLLPAQAGQPAAAIWLPIFYAPLLALFFYRAHVPFLAALMAPTINRLLTGLPDMAMSTMLTVELFIFVCALWIWRNYFKDSWLMGGIAYVAAKFISVLFFKSFLAEMSLDASAVYFVGALWNAIPGICVLSLVTGTCIRLKAKG